MKKTTIALRKLFFPYACSERRRWEVMNLFLKVSQRLRAKGEPTEHIDLCLHAALRLYDKGRYDKAVYAIKLEP